MITKITVEEIKEGDTILVNSKPFKVHYIADIENFSDPIGNIGVPGKEYHIRRLYDAEGNRYSGASSAECLLIK